MNAIVAGLTPASMPAAPAACAMSVTPDPLDDDQPDDEVVVTTRRGMVRVALVATEVASRFQREGVTRDPMAWMLSPRSMFGGAAAIDACVERAACLRGVLMHGLSLGLDAEPDTIDALLTDINEAGEADIASRPDQETAVGGGITDILPPIESKSTGSPRLYTATVVAGDGRGTLQAFHASLATDEAEVAGRLYWRIGAASAGAHIFAGFDAGNPLVAALVSPAICDTLSLIASDPGSPLAAGLDLNIEQRFLA